MRTGDVLILRGAEVASLLEGEELALIEQVRAAYAAHAAGQSSLPRSTFLRFPDNERNRIIALPSYLGQDFDVAGIKWIASFPDNLRAGLERASAVVILNSTITGQAEVILEGSLISAKRTAASAALAARTLHADAECDVVALLGCGVINFEIAKMLRTVYPSLNAFTVFDASEAQAEQFGERCRKAWPSVKVELAADVPGLLRSAKLVSIATTASVPHIFSLEECAPGSTILHVSLRDLSPEVILGCDNVVDDVDHVCCAQTSVHLAEQLTEGREFIRCTLADVLCGDAPSRLEAGGITVFSPFGLGVLDVAVASFVHRLAAERGLGTVVESFIP
jgi:ornithine cyclodeaminase